MTTPRQDHRGRILITGATGYVGGRLLTRLRERGSPLRALVRDPARVAPELREGVEWVTGDLMDVASVRRAVEGVETAYYLAHAMAGSGDFAEADRQAALIFAEAAREAGVSKIIYLGGLGKGDALSPHLASRHEVGEILRTSGVPTLEFRSGIIIGRGSLSFELISALVQRLPVMVAPRWVSVETQPIAIEDVLRYLEEALDLTAVESEIFEIGGPDRVSYRQMMLEYAKQAGYRRRILPVPVLTPWLSSLWLGLVTPLQARVGRKLIDSVRNETVVDDQRARQLFGFRPRGIEQAIREAMSDPTAGAPPGPLPKKVAGDHHQQGEERDTTQQRVVEIIPR